MWFSLAKMALKTGTHIYQNKQKSKQLMSDAALLHSEKMAKGELEYKAKIIESNDNGWKDEFVLILISMPICILAWSIFSDDPEIHTKLTLFFDKLDSMPWWITGLWVSVVAAIYGIKATDIIKTNKK